MHTFWESNCFDRAPRSERITGQQAGLDRRAEFSAKMGIVVEEADKTIFWLECLSESGIVKQELLKELIREANELVAIFAASHSKARKLK